MVSLVSHKYFRFLILLMLFATACSQTLEPTQAPTTVSTATLATVPPEPQITILESQVVVEQITIMDPALDTGEMQVFVKGHTSNTCTAVDGVTVSREGDVFSVQVETKTKISSDCQQKAVQFEEIMIVDTRNLEPGAYLVTSGVVQTFEIAPAQPEEEAEVTDESTSGGETGDESESMDEEADADAPAPESATQPVSDEPRDCQDRAIFVADITIPDNAEVTAGEVFTKTWEIRNDGTCNWGPGYELEFVQGAFEQAIPLDDPFPVTAPDESVNLSVAVTAPRTAGTHTGIWVINRPEGDVIQTQDGQNFDFWAIVVVPASTSATTPGSREINSDGVVCAQTNTAYVAQLLQLINDERTANGLPAYEQQDQLTNAAKALTTDMACNDFVSHTGTDGSDWYDRITAQGYVYDDAAENIVFGYGTVPQLAMNWWMSSAIHRGNILSKTLTQIGIAYALNPQNGGSYYTLVFAVPPE